MDHTDKPNEPIPYCLRNVVPFGVHFSRVCKELDHERETIQNLAIDRELDSIDHRVNLGQNLE